MDEMRNEQMDNVEEVDDVDLLMQVNSTFLFEKKEKRNG